MTDTVEGRIEVGSTGKDLDSTIITQADGAQAYREAVVIADPANNDARVALVDARLYEGKALPVVDAQNDSMIQLLQEIRDEMRITNELLKGMF